MTPHILAVDHGTSGIKAALVSARGEVRDFESVPTTTRFLPDGGAEQDPDEWWDALASAARRLVARTPVARETIAAVCVSSTFSTTVAVDAAGQALRPALTWMDSRGAPHVRRAVGGFPAFRGYHVPHLWNWLSRTGGAPSLSGKDDAAHALLIREEWPEIYERVRFFLPSKDYLNLRLTGKAAASWDSIHLFWVTDARDPSAVRYDPRLAARLGLDLGKLPPLRGSTEVLGSLTPAAADALGLAPATRVVVGSPDHQCALFGSGAVRDFEGHLYVGTSSWIECLVPFKKTDVLHSIASFPTAVAGRYQCVNEQDLAGGALTFLFDNILRRCHELFGVDVPDLPYAAVDRIAATVPAGSGGVVFTPWLNGERTPVDDVQLRGGFHNLSTTTTLDHMVRAVLEGVALNTRWSLRHVERFCGRPLRPLRIVGGGARSDLWCQIFADVLDREVHRVRDPLEANARGAALIAAIACGWLRFEEIPALVPIERIFRPDAALRPTYDRLFAAFLGLYRPGRRLYRRLSSI